MSDDTRFVYKRTDETISWVEAEPPRRRDLWAILRGRYVPRLRHRNTTTLKGFDRILRETYTTDCLEEALGKPPLL